MTTLNRLRFTPSRLQRRHGQRLRGGLLLPVLLCVLISGCSNVDPLPRATLPPPPPAPVPKAAPPSADPESLAQAAPPGAAKPSNTSEDSANLSQPAGSARPSPTKTEKPAAKPVTSVEPKPVAKPAPKPKLKPEPAPVKKPAPQPKPIPAAQALAKPEPVAVPTPEPKPTPEAESSAVSVATSKPELAALTPPAAETVNAASSSSAPAIEAAASSTAPPPQTDLTSLNLDTVPVAIGEFWTLNRDGKTCLLEGEPTFVFDGFDRVPVQMILRPDSWLITTPSNIDLTYTDTGIWVGDMEPAFPLEAVHEATDIRITQAHGALIEALKSADFTRIAIGFWPTWPVTESRSVHISTSGFGEAYRVWLFCNEQMDRL